MRLEDFLSGDAFTIVNKKLAKAIGIGKAIFLQELISQRKRFGENEFYFTQNNMEEELGISTKTQQRYANELKEMGLIDFHRKGIPARSYYTINDMAIINFIPNGKTSSVKMTEQAQSKGPNYYNKKENKKEKEIKEKDTLFTSSSRDDMLEMFRNDPTLTRCMNEEDVIKWWDFKQDSKKPYKNVGSFRKALVKIKNILKFRPDGYPNSDRERKNRFNYAVDEAVEGRWEGLDWYDKMEKAYELSKDDLYPN